ncbi:MAG: hypothetical protein HY826_07180 [Actinobacteria bacterium]|nr:hypothetical protein [Actinomycetota bacterium]
MKLLLIESTPGNASELSAQLTADGHHVLQCADDSGGPCRGTTQHTDCPLEEHIDLAILTREHGAQHTLAEMGAVCATRHRVPSVVIDPTQIQDEMPSVTVAKAVAERAVEAGYAAAVREELAMLPAVVEVRRLPDHVQVHVQLPASQNSPAAISAAADRARAAVRAHDPFVQRIDVAIGCYPD